MAKGEIKGNFLFGQNPGGGGPNAGLHRAGLRNLDWLVVLDWFEIESAVFWKSDPKGPPPGDIKTEVFLFPVAGAQEKEEQSHQHSATNSVARQGHRPPRRQPLRCLVPLQPGTATQGALRRLHRSQGPAPAQPHLGLRF